MDSDVVEVVARFGGTIIDVAHVGATDTYRIGTAPGCAVAVPGLTCFPLVESGRLRCPVGVPAVERDGWTELRVGALSLHVTRTKLTGAPLARPGVDWRTPLFVLVSLIAHLAVWLVAVRFAPFERLPAAKAVLRLARIEHPSDPPPPPKPPPPRPPPRAASAQPARGPRVARPPRGGAKPRGQAEPALSTAEVMSAAIKGALGDPHALEQVEDLRPEDQYVEDDANARGFGGSRRFDPTQREGWGTVESGPYAMMPLGVKQCPDKKQCMVEGPIPALYVRTHLLAHMDAIYDCYMQHASEPGTIVLEFTITADGAVRDARGSGLGETGACAARVASEIFFKALGAETRVRWPVRFKPSPG